MDPAANMPKDIQNFSPFDIPFSLNLEEAQESESSVPVLAAFFVQREHKRGLSGVIHEVRPCLPHLVFTTL